MSEQTSRNSDATKTHDPVVLGEALPYEMTRVRDLVMPAYVEIGAPGLFALSMMRIDLDRAAKALAEGDVIEMLRVYESLKEYQV